MEEKGPGITPLFSFWLSNLWLSNRLLGLSGMEGRAVVETLGGRRRPQGQHRPKHSLGVNLYRDKIVRQSDGRVNGPDPTPAYNSDSDDATSDLQITKDDHSNATSSQTTGTETRGSIVISWPPVTTFLEGSPEFWKSGLKLLYGLKAQARWFSR